MAVKEDIVISGISGRFPESDNVEEFADNLFSATDMIQEHNDRWPAGSYQIPKRYGAIKDVSRFDAIFFGIHARQVNVMDAQIRILLESVYEAIIDSGYNMEDFSGTKTGVFVGASTSEMHDYYSSDMTKICGYEMTGCTRSMFANRISFCYNLTGPSFTVDTACSSSLVALDMARRSIESGVCNAAIVAGSGILARPASFSQFNKLGMLSPTGKCHSFDDRCNGYVRSDAVGVVIMQKKTAARRIYANLIHSKINTDGFKEQGITYPSGEMQAKLLKEIYFECKVDPASVFWVEAHGTGTKVGDPEEIKSICSVLCSNNVCEKRGTPLLLTSVKSNCGHSEPASGIVALIRVLLCMKRGKISPNLNFKNLNPQLKPMMEGKCRVVDSTVETWPKKNGFVGINSFGFGGANAHVVLQCRESQQANVKDLQLVESEMNASVKKLIVYTGRSKESLEIVLKHVAELSQNAILHQYIEKTIYNKHDYRGYLVMNGPDDVVEEEKIIIEEKGELKSRVAFIFSGMGSQWVGMGKAFLQITTFRESLYKCNTALKKVGICVFDIINSESKSVFESVINSFVCIAAIQVALVDVLTHIGITADIFVGHSVGELGCSYADGCLTAQQTVLAAYYRGLSVENAKLPPGVMAAVGLSWDEAVKRCPDNVHVACHNSKDGVTISGRVEAVECFVQELKNEGIFARKVNSSNIAFHSPDMLLAAPMLRKYLKEVITDPKNRSKKWISSSQDDDENKLCSAEYHVMNLISSVKFCDAVAKIPEKTIIIEVAPHALLQSVLKRNVATNCTIVGLMNLREPTKCIEYFLNSLGKCFLSGLKFSPSKLRGISDLNVPISGNYPSISSIMKWDHSQQWSSPQSLEIDSLMGKSKCDHHISYDISDKHSFLKGHIIDGRKLFPATGYIFTVWKAFADEKGVNFENLKVYFTDITIHRPVFVPETGTVDFSVQFLPDSDKFLLINAKNTIVTGNIVSLDDNVISKNVPDWLQEIDNEIDDLVEKSALKCDVFSKKDVYSILRIRGYDYMNDFCLVEKCAKGGLWGEIEWKDEWISFMDSMLQMSILSSASTSLKVPVGIKSVIINPVLHFECLNLNNDDERNFLDFDKCEYENVFSCGGVEMEGLQVSKAPRRSDAEKIVTEEFKFIEKLCQVNELIDWSNDGNVAVKNIVADVLNIVVDNFNSSGVLNVCDFSFKGLYKWVHGFIDSQPLLNCIVGVYNDDGVGQDVEKFSLEKVDTATNDCDLIILSNDDGTFFNNQVDFFNNIDCCKKMFVMVLSDKNELNVSLFGNFFLVLQHTCSNSKIHLFVKNEVEKDPKFSKKSNVIFISNDNFDWVEDIKRDLNSKKKPVWLVSIENISGIVGLFKCLKKECGGDKFRVFIDAKADKISILEGTNEAFLKAVQSDLVINVVRNGKLGYYSHRPLVDNEYRLVENAYVNNTVKGDLSSLKWIQLASFEGHNSLKEFDHFKTVKVAYSSLNFRDVMLATGRLSSEALPGDFKPTDPILGLEFSGYTKQGERIMGIVPAKGLATSVHVHESFVFPVPSEWDMAQAATVPVVYTTSYYSLIVRGKIKKGEWVLIHSGSGGVGQAALNIAHSVGCRIITTVGSDAKRNFLLKKYPWLSPQHVSDSRNYKNFSSHVKRLTRGYGVDVVLNSLAGEFLMASVDLLAHHGRFLEIGKADLSNNTKLGMSLFLKNVSFHGILLDSLFDGSNDEWLQVKQLFKMGIESKVVVPLHYTEFKCIELEKAFRFMSTGKHVGKVVINVMSGNDNDHKIPAIPKSYCDPCLEYVILGGMGGIGLELCAWLIDRNARFLTISSRSGVKSAYHEYKIELLSKKCRVNVEKVDIANKNVVSRMIDTILFKRSIGGIFNLAAVSHDGMMDSQTSETFKKVQSAKYLGTVNVDECLRDKNVNPRWFVCFSSISCGRGNAGQTNYGYANCLMEEICRKRNFDGLNAMAIQWGAVGDVGMAIELLGSNSMSIGGTKPQRIPSLLNSLDSILTCHDKSVISVFSLAEKGKVEQEKVFDLLKSVAKILGIDTLSKIQKNTKLSALGLDSLMSVEVKQLLESKCNVVLNQKEIRSISIDDLNTFTTNLSSIDADSTLKEEKNDKQAKCCNSITDKFFFKNTEIFRKNIKSRYNLENLVPDKCIVLMSLNGRVVNETDNPNEYIEDLKLSLIKTVLSKKTLPKSGNNAGKLHTMHNRIQSNVSNCSVSSLTEMTSISSFDSGLNCSENDIVGKSKTYDIEKMYPLFIVHPLEGSVQSLYEFASHISGKVYGIQCCKGAPLDNIYTLAQYYIDEMKTIQPTGPYRLVGYSYGCSVTIIMVSMLEKSNEIIQSLHLLDGSHKYVHTRMSHQIQSVSEQDWSLRALCFFTNQFLNINVQQLYNYLISLPDENSRTKFVTRMIVDNSPIKDEKSIIDASSNFFKLLLICFKTDIKTTLTCKNVILVKSSDVENGELVKVYGEDFGIQTLCKEKITVYSISGDHLLFLRGSNALHLSKLLQI